MSIAQSLLPEFDHEMAGTRKALERAPATHASWRPHEMSMTLAQLTTHLAEIPRFVPRIVHDDELELYPVGGEPFERKTPLPVESAVAVFDENVREAREALAAATDEQLLRPWTLKVQGRPSFTLPKVAAFRTLTMYHLVHHRGQLSVFLRLLGAPVPGMYGPSADERLGR
ncbi:MAG TPA: DinB family protein [Gemmatimonadaceae bacterium]